MTSRILAITFAVLFCSLVNADEWPQFRGPTGDGISTATNVPVEWSASENVAWKQPILGTGWSSPVLSQGKIYLTTAVSEEDKPVSLRALCLAAADGHVIWNEEVLRPEETATGEKHTKNSAASPTPYLEGDRLYVHFGHLGTAALDLNGKVVWRQTELSYHPKHGNGGSPIVVGDMLVFSCDGLEDPFVVALDRGTGNVRWKTPRNIETERKFSFCTPTLIDVDGQPQIISQGSAMVAAYDPRDGHEIWRVRYGDGYSVVPRPVYADGLLFVASGFERPILYAIDPKGAKDDATETHIVWTREKGAPLTPSVIVVGKELYCVSDNGVASCLDARTGNVHWIKRLGGDFSASPVYAEGRVYFGSEDGVTYVIQAGTAFEQIAANDLEERMLASPAVADGVIYLRSEGNLWRIENSPTTAAGN